MADNSVTQRQERIALRRQNRVVRTIVAVGIVTSIVAMIIAGISGSIATPNEVKASIQKRPPHHTLNDG